MDDPSFGSAFPFVALAKATCCCRSCIEKAANGCCNKRRCISSFYRQTSFLRFTLFALTGNCQYQKHARLFMTMLVVLHERLAPNMYSAVLSFSAALRLAGETVMLILPCGWPHRRMSTCSRDPCSPGLHTAGT